MLLDHLLDGFRRQVTDVVTLEVTIVPPGPRRRQPHALLLPLVFVHPHRHRVGVHHVDAVSRFCKLPRKREQPARPGGRRLPQGQFLQPQPRRSRHQTHRDHRQARRNHPVHRVWRRTPSGGRRRWFDVCLSGKNLTVSAANRKLTVCCGPSGGSGSPLLPRPRIIPPRRRRSSLPARNFEGGETPIRTAKVWSGPTRPLGGQSRS